MERLLMSKLLPIGSPLVYGYLCNAYPLSIVSVEDKYLDWFYSNYIQMVTHLPSGTFFTFYTPYYEWYEYLRQCPFIEYQKLGTDIMEQHPEGILQFIMDRIDKDWYVELYLDEYFLSSKRAYQRFHFPHEILIYGYNKEEAKFNTIGYNERTIYGHYEIGFEEFLEAYKNCFRDQVWEKVPYQKFLYLLQYNSNYEFPFDTRLVIDSLKEYLSGYNSSNHFRALKPPTVAPNEGLYSYGTDLYKRFNEFLQYKVGEQKQEMNVRFSHTMWEHKKIMLQRIQYLGEKGLLSDKAEYYSEFEKVEKKALIVLNSCIKYQIKPSEIVLQSLLETSSEVEQMERVILNKLIQELEAGEELKVNSRAELKLSN